MSKQFFAYLTGGNSVSFLKDLTKFLVLHDIDDIIPSIRVERQAKSQFYFFLENIVGETARHHDLPKELQDFLQIRSCHYLDVLSWEEIRKMVGPECKPAEGALPLAYQSPLPPVVDDFGVPEDDIDRGDQTHRYDVMLAFLSAVGWGSWDQFRQIVREAWGNDGPPPRAIARRLQLLGHFERKKDRWSIAPAVLVPTPVSGEFVLCGQRSTRLIHTLESCAEVRRSPQPGRDGPSRITVQTDDLMGVVEDVQRRLDVSIAIGSAEALAHALPPLPRWQGQLERVGGIVPALFSRCQRFNVVDFVDTYFDETRSGFYRFWRDHERDRPAFEGFWDATQQVWLQGDWYGLRLLAHQANGSPVYATYDRVRRLVQVPEITRPPELYERALTLSGGYLPERKQGWLVYREVCAEVVAALGSKLDWQRTDGDDWDV